MCPAHGEEAVVVHPGGLIGCRECTRIKIRVAQIRDRNRRTRSAHNKKGQQHDRHPLEKLNRVSNQPLRDAFLELTSKGLMTASEIAVAAGYLTRRRSREGGGEIPDIQRLKKQLGLIAEVGKKNAAGVRPKAVRELMDYDVAERLRCAMGIEYPCEVGI